MQLVYFYRDRRRLADGDRGTRIHSGDDGREGIVVSVAGGYVSGAADRPVRVNRGAEFVAQFDRQLDHRARWSQRRVGQVFWPDAEHHLLAEIPIPAWMLGGHRRRYRQPVRAAAIAEPSVEWVRTGRGRNRPGDEHGRYAAKLSALHSRTVR